MKRFLRRFAATHSHKDAEALTDQGGLSHAMPTQQPMTPKEGEQAQGAESLTGETRGPANAPAARRDVVPASLAGMHVPSLLFNNFDRRFIDLAKVALDGLVLYVYPGCSHTPSDGAGGLEADAAQHRAYSLLRDSFAEILPGGALVALSSIEPTHQFHHSPELAWDQDQEAILDHYLVSDEMLQLAEELGLPTFEHEGDTHYERLTLVARGGRIQHVFHPVTPGQDAHQALTWLRLH